MNKKNLFCIKFDHSYQKYLKSRQCSRNSALFPALLACFRSQLAVSPTISTVLLKFLINSWLFPKKDATSLSEDELSIQKLALDFAKQKLEPSSLLWDRTHEFPLEIVREAAASGFGGIYVSPDFGGCGLKRLDASLIFEALSTGDVPVAALLSVHNMCAWILDEFFPLFIGSLSFFKVWNHWTEENVAGRRHFHQETRQLLLDGAWKRLGFRGNGKFSLKIRGF